MIALVTGAAGFIGSHLVDRLLKEGFRVRGVDDFSTGRRSNLAAALRQPRFALHEADVAEGGLQGLFRGVDWVFHLAGRVDIVPSVRDPGPYWRANVDGTFAVLEAARATRVRRFIYAASSSCYGLARKTPTPETAPARPRYPYALTKWLGEEAVLHWSRVFALPGVSLRLFNVYGPRSRTSGAYGAVFGVFLAQKLAGRPFTVVGDGRQSRDFVHVSDVAEAFFMAARSPLRGSVLNVGTGRPQTINRLVGLLRGPSVAVPRRPGEPRHTHADIRRIRRLLGWRPRVVFEDGVRGMLESIRDWNGAPVWTPASIRRETAEWFKRVS